MGIVERFMTGTGPDQENLKSKLKSPWMAGGFGAVAKSIESHAEAFISRRRTLPGWATLDVACGTGNLAIPASKEEIPVQMGRV